jgi:hypothetical protein
MVASSPVLSIKKHKNDDDENDLLHANDDDYHHKKKNKDSKSTQSVNPEPETTQKCDWLYCNLKQQ